MDPPSEFDDKEDFRGAVLVVLGFEREGIKSTLPGAKDGDTYDTLRVRVSGETDEHVIVSGMVMSRQIRDMVAQKKLPFRAKLLIPKGKRYWALEPV